MCDLIRFNLCYRSVNYWMRSKVNRDGLRFIQNVKTISNKVFTIWTPNTGLQIMHRTKSVRKQIMQELFVPKYKTFIDMFIILFCFQLTKVNIIYKKRLNMIIVTIWGHIYNTKKCLCQNFDIGPFLILFTPIHVVKVAKQLRLP